MGESGKFHPIDVFSFSGGFKSEVQRVYDAGVAVS